MRISLHRESLLQPLMGLSKRNKKWIADRLYESISRENASTIEDEKTMLFKSIRDGLDDIKHGRTFPAEDLFKHLDDDND